MSTMRRGALGEAGTTEALLLLLLCRLVAQQSQLLGLSRGVVSNNDLYLKVANLR